MKSFGSSYTRFLVASGISSLGDGLLLTGLPLIARSTTSNPFMIAAVSLLPESPGCLGLPSVHTPINVTLDDSW